MVTTKAIGSEIINLGAVELLQGAADPSAGLGVAAPVGSTYYRTNGQQWSKTGPADTAWTMLGSGGGSFQGAWAAGTYAAGSIVTDSNLTLGTTASTSVAPVVTTTLPAITDVTGWQYNGAAVPQPGVPPYGSLINAPAQGNTIISKAALSFDTYLELDFSIAIGPIPPLPSSSIADAYYVGLLDSALPDTTPVLLAQAGFWGVQFWMYTGGGSPQFMVPLINGSAAGSAQVVTSTTTNNVNSYFFYRMAFNIFDGMCLLTLWQDGNIIFRQWLKDVPTFTSARVAFGGQSGGLGCDARLGDLVSTIGPNAPWKRLP